MFLDNLSLQDVLRWINLGDKWREKHPQYTLVLPGRSYKGGSRGDFPSGRGSARGRNVGRPVGLNRGRNTFQGGWEKVRISWISTKPRHVWWNPFMFPETYDMATKPARDNW